MTTYYQPAEDHELSIGHVGAVLRRGWFRLLLGFLVGLALGAGLFAVTPPSYSSRAVVAITPTVSGPSSSTKDISTSTESAVVTSSSVADRAAPTMQWTQGSATLLKHVSVSSPLDSQLLVIQFRGASPAVASRGANAFAAGYLAYRLDTAQAELKAKSDRLEQRIAVLETAATDQAAIMASPTSTASKVAQAKSSQSSALRLIGQLRDQQVNVQTTIVSPGQIIDKGLPPTTRNFPRLPVFLLGGALLGLLAGVAAAFWRAAHDTRVSDARLLEEKLSLTVLADVPVPMTSRRTAATLASMVDPGGAEADAYRTLAAKVTAKAPQAPRSILIVGAGPLTITTTPINLAVTLAASGHRVALIGVKSAMVAAAAALAEDGAIPDPGDDLRELLHIGDLSIVSLGQEVTIDATLRRRFEELQRIRTSRDVLIVDSVNVTLPSTALGLAQLCDRTLVVSQQWRTRTGDITTTLHELRHLLISVAGAVLLRPVAGRRSQPRGNGQPHRLEMLDADLASPRQSPF